MTEVLRIPSRRSNLSTSHGVSPVLPKSFSRSMALVASLVGVGTTAAFGGDAQPVEAFCVTSTFPVVPCGESCVAAATSIVATEVDGVRHIVWLQNQNALAFYAAKILPNGDSTVTTVPLAPSLSSARAIAGHGDLLVVGTTGGLSIHRLVDHEWIVETMFTGAFTHESARVRISVGPDGITRVFASRTDLINEGGFGSSVRVYRLDGEWSLETTISVPAQSDRFGADLAIDGDTLVVGSPRAINLAPATGLNVYRLVDGDWTPEAALDFDNGPYFGIVNLPGAIGHRVAFIGDTAVAMNAEPFALLNSLVTGIGLRGGLVVHHRTAKGWAHTETIRPRSTRFGIGNELKAFMDGDDVIVIATVHRTFSPVIDGLLAFRIRDGVVIDEYSISVPSPEFPELNATTYDVALVTGESTWMAVTVPRDPLAAIRVLELDPSRCAPKIVGDINGDGVVDAADLGLLLSQWGPCPDLIGACAGDLNGDGVVDAADLGILLTAWSAGS